MDSSMRAKFVNEFERGIDPKKALKIGVYAQILPLIQRYIDRNAREDYNYTAEELLKSAIKGNNIPVAMYALTLNPNLTHKWEGYKWSSARYKPLLNAYVYTENAEFIEKLLELGADPNIFATEYDTASVYNVSLLQKTIYDSLFQNTAKIFDVLIKHGADPNFQNGGPLLQAIKINNLYFIKELIKAGATLKTNGGRIVKYINKNKNNIDDKILSIINSIGYDESSKNNVG